MSMRRGGTFRRSVLLDQKYGSMRHLPAAMKLAAAEQGESGDGSEDLPPDLPPPPSSRETVFVPPDLGDSHGTRNLATLGNLSEETILDELQLR